MSCDRTTQRRAGGDLKREEIALSHEKVYDCFIRDLWSIVSLSIVGKENREWMEELRRWMIERNCEAKKKRRGVNALKPERRNCWSFQWKYQFRRSFLINELLYINWLSCSKPFRTQREILEDQVVFLGCSWRVSREMNRFIATGKMVSSWRLSLKWRQYDDDITPVVSYERTLLSFFPQNIRKKWRSNQCCDLSLQLSNNNRYMRHELCLTKLFHTGRQPTRYQVSNISTLIALKCHLIVPSTKISKSARQGEKRLKAFWCERNGWKFIMRRVIRNFVPPNSRTFFSLFRLMRKQFFLLRISRKKGIKSLRC